MPSAILTICPHSENNQSSLSSWVPNMTLPSRGTVAKGAAVVVGVGACYMAYQSFQTWCANWSPLDYFRENDKKEDTQ